MHLQQMFVIAHMLLAVFQPIVGRRADDPVSHGDVVQSYLEHLLLLLVGVLAHRCGWQTRRSERIGPSHCSSRFGSYRSLLGLVKERLLVLVNEYQDELCLQFS